MIKIEVVLNQFLKQYPFSKVTILAMSGMAGFPNPITGKLPKHNYINELEQHFQERGIETNSYQLQNLFFQKSHFIKNVICSNPTIAELKTLLSCSIGVTKQRYLLAKVGIRSTVKNLYKINPSDYETRIWDILKQKDFIFFVLL